jgi:DNA-binding IclR family transcriptional regulator
LAGQIVQNSRLARRARPYVARLHDRTGLAAHLVAPSYQSALCLVHHAATDSTLGPQLRELVPAHCTAGGKALLAERARWRESILGAPLARHTDRTVTRADTLRRELRDAHARGYAVEDCEFQEHVRAVAAPVFVGDEAVAALVASGDEVDVDSLAGPVVTLARELTQDLHDEGA